MRRFFFLLLVLTVSFSLAGTKKYKRRTAIAYRLHSAPIKIDGHLSDAAWQAIPFQGKFTQLNPVEGAAPSQRTVFKILYDEHSLYLGFQCYDRNPQLIASRLSRRDDVQNSDFIAIGLDSYFDRRTAFIFGVNPAGVKFDMVISNDGDRQDDSWDPVWDEKTSISDSGWTAEMKIPYSQIRFADKQNQLWGFQVLRKIYRTQEEDIWQFIPKDAGGFVSYFGDLKGIKNIRMPKRVELLPYGVSSNRRYEPETGNPFADGNDFKINLGLDGKIGLSSDLTMDFTINPDFGQVEADPSEVNLSAFETYFAEKRPFFVEGKNIFMFPLAMGDGDFSRETLFYSRRIGREPHYYPDEEDGFHYDYVDMPEQTHILGAAKISGKTQRGWSVGILDAVTNLEKATLDYNGQQRKITVEPLTNYFVNRVQKDFNKGNTSFGGMFTATHRRINEKQLNFLNKSAYTGGIDIRHQWDHKTYFMSLKMAGSYLKGDPEAIVRVQRSSARYFQRPDAHYLKLDSSRTTLSGHGGSLDIGRVGNSPWRIGGGITWRSPGLELNDIGYLRQADDILNYVWGGYRLFNPLGILRNARINVNFWQGWNFGGQRLFLGGNINGGMSFTNYWGLFMGLNRQQPGLSSTMLRGGPMARTEGQWNSWFNISSDKRKSLAFKLNGFWSSNDDRISGSRELNLDMRWRISDRFNMKAEPFFNDQTDNLQYINTLVFQGKDRYISGRLQQKTFGITLRLNYSLTPNLSIQYYGQPFISAGSYSYFKRITHPRASQRYQVFTGRVIRLEEDQYLIDENGDGQNDYSFDNPDFNFRQFRSNLVMRWEYRPGSTLFFVWSQSRTGYDASGWFNLKNDMNDLFSVWPDNVLLIKANYWFSL